LPKPKLDGLFRGPTKTRFCSFRSGLTWLGAASNQGEVRISARKILTYFLTYPEARNRPIFTD
jgi:hypothetical protein